MGSAWASVERWLRTPTPATSTSMSADTGATRSRRPPGAPPPTSSCTATSTCPEPGSWCSLLSAWCACRRPSRPRDHPLRCRDAYLRRAASWDQRRRQEPDPDGRPQGMPRGRRVRPRRHLHRERQRRVRLQGTRRGCAHPAHRTDAGRPLRAGRGRRAAHARTDAIGGRERADRLRHRPEPLPLRRDLPQVAADAREGDGGRSHPRRRGSGVARPRGPVLLAAHQPGDTEPHELDRRHARLPADDDPELEDHDDLR